MRIDFPPDDALVVNIKTGAKGTVPVYAVVASPEYWYSWTNPKLFNLTHDLKAQPETFTDLVNFEAGNSAEHSAHYCLKPTAYVI